MAAGTATPRAPRTGRPTLDVERRLWRQGHRWVAGIDEVGRGAWAGPVSVGVAVVHTGCRTRSMPVWLRDSKALAEERREAIYDEVAAWCADGAVGHATAAECDRWGMTGALRLAAYRALAALEVVPDAIVLDGPFDYLHASPAGLLAASPARSPVDAAGAGDASEEDNPGEGSPADALVADALRAAATAPMAPTATAQATAPAARRPPPPLPAVRLPETVLPVVDGDAHCAAVSAASVLAKVVRDRGMRADAEHYPAYDFDRNKGYPSPAHKLALRGYGLSAIHRRSWAYVAGLPWAGGHAPTY